MSKTKSISFIGSVGVPANYGGFETLVEQLCLHLNNNFYIRVYCSSKSYSKAERDTNWNHIKRSFIPVRANGIQSILYDTISLFKAGRKSDIICFLGCSGAISIPLFKIFYPRVKLIFHPDGKEWKRTKWNKPAKLFLCFSTYIGCVFSNKIIIDNSELKLNNNKNHQKSVFIPYGGDQYSAYKTTKRANPTYWLTIARAEPENNLELIADAILQSKQRWVLISNFANTPYGRQLKNKYSNKSNIQLINQTYDNTTIANYLTNCKGYIHGHTAGGTNPSLVSAMFINKPLLCHNNKYNISTTNSLSLFFTSQEELYKLLTQNSSQSKLHESAYEYATANYLWMKICNDYKQLFKSIHK